MTLKKILVTFLLISLLLVSVAQAGLLTNLFSSGNQLTGFVVDGNGWTNWLNRDSPSGKGDYETLNDFNPSLVCDGEIPVAVECRRISDHLYYNETGEVVHASPTVGCWCINSEQVNSSYCSNYEVRFQCAQQACPSLNSSDFSSDVFVWSEGDSAIFGDYNVTLFRVGTTSALVVVGGQMKAVANGETVVFDAADYFEVTVHAIAYGENCPENQAALAFSVSELDCPGLVSGFYGEDLIISEDEPEVDYLGYTIMLDAVFVDDVGHGLATFSIDGSNLFMSVNSTVSLPSLGLEVSLVAVAYQEGCPGEIALIIEHIPMNTTCPGLNSSDFSSDVFVWSEGDSALFGDYNVTLLRVGTTSALVVVGGQMKAVTNGETVVFDAADYFEVTVHAIAYGEYCPENQAALSFSAYVDDCSLSTGYVEDVDVGCAAGYVETDAYVGSDLICCQEDINSTIACEDTDGGINPDVKGEISGDVPPDLGILVDICLDGSDHPMGYNLRETYCDVADENDDGYAGTAKLIACPHGCDDGACLVNSTTDDLDCLSVLSDAGKFGYCSSQIDGCAAGDIVHNELNCGSNAVCCQHISIDNGCRTVLKAEGKQGYCSSHSMGCEDGDILRKDLVCEGNSDAVCCEDNFNLSVPSKPVVPKPPSIFNETNCNGCMMDENCYDFGVRVNGRYCATNGYMLNQQGGNNLCENNFECMSNICASGECVDASVFRKFLHWLNRVFG